eukprot:165920-Prorocentrum_minimum.AAC.2
MAPCTAPLFTLSAPRVHTRAGGAPEAVLVDQSHLAAQAEHSHHRHAGQAQPGPLLLQRQLSALAALPPLRGGQPHGGHGGGALHRHVPQRGGQPVVGAQPPQPPPRVTSISPRVLLGGKEH